MKIWIDLTTAPQVLFFRPIIAEMEKRGIDTVITSRHFTETVPLADSYGFSHTVIGRHGGKTLLGKIVMNFVRILELVMFLRKQQILVAVSHGSYSQAITAKLTGIPFVTFQDYEGHPGTHITARIAKRIFVPTLFDPEVLTRFGSHEGQVETYADLKERIYLSDFRPDPTVLDRIGISPEQIIVTMRPPSLVSTYHRFENPLFDEILEHVTSHTEVTVVLIPRGDSQVKFYGSKKLHNTLIPDHVIDGPNLIYYSDLVVGAGGTMNREAVVLGTPVYTVFGGELGSVDRSLVDLGLMRRIESREQIPEIDLRKKNSLPDKLDHEKRDLVPGIVDKIVNLG